MGAMPNTAESLRYDQSRIYRWSLPVALLHLLSNFVQSLVLAYQLNAFRMDVNSLTSRGIDQRCEVPIVGNDCTFGGRWRELAAIECKLVWCETPPIVTS